MKVDVDIGEIKENQDALEGLLNYAGVPQKWIKLALSAYTANIACDKEQMALFDRVFKKTHF